MSAIDKIIIQFSAEKEETSQKPEYIEKITKKLELCNDIPLLDLIDRLLTKSL